MTLLRTLILNDFRCFEQARFTFEPGLNVIEGGNGRGKTALLEALWLLATGRSFRTTQLRQLIRHGAREATVFAEVGAHRLGWSRMGEQTRLRCDGQTVRGQATLSQHLPLQLMTPESHRLLSGSPRYRRQFLDWGGFYHDEAFMAVWRQYHRVLKQRNHALRQHLEPALVRLWDEPLAQSGERLDALRQHYLSALQPFVRQMLVELMPDLAEMVQLRYGSGWPVGRSLREALEESERRDRLRGATQVGPHRGDLQIRMEGREAVTVLSRGQQKLFVVALLLAQSELLRQARQRTAIMLLDDLPAELDRLHRERVLKLLETMQIQRLVTTTDVALLPGGSAAYRVVL